MNFTPITTRAALIAVMALVLTACGSSTEEAADQPVLGNSGAVDFSGSYPIPNCTGLDSASCAYEGFDPAVDGFSFENWGAPGNIGASEMIALFGRKKVCASGSGGNCVLYPGAQQWADQINEALSGGHCEGMAVTAELIHGGYLDPSDFDPNATSTYDLTLDNPTVSSTIEYWWATQMVEPVQEAYQKYQTYQPSQIAQKLAIGLKAGTGYTVGIYSPAGGHAVTPIAVTNEGALKAIHVYDNNFPGTVQRIMIDPRSETWSYAMGSTNPETPTGGWEGGQGTIELTPMESRLQSPFPAPFEDMKSGGKTSELLITSPNPDSQLGVRLAIGSAVYDIGDPNVALPAGVNVRSTLGAVPMATSVPPVLDGNWVSVIIDRDLVGDFKATLVPNKDQTEPIPVTMSIDGPGSPRVTVRAITDSDETESVSFDVGLFGEVEINFDGVTDSTVNVSNGVNSANFPVPDGVNMNVDSRDADGETIIDFMDEQDGEIIGEFELPDESDNGSVTEINAEFIIDEDGNGFFEVTEEEVKAEEVDEDWIKSVEGAADPSSEFGDDEPGNDDSGNDDSGNDEPGNDEPANDEPGNDEPGNDEPGNDEPANDEPGNDEPGNDEPGNDEPANDEPANDEPANDEPANDEPANDEPAEE
jgi:hypothetical protein